MAFTTTPVTQQETLNLINGDEINSLKAAALTDISFDLLLPQVSYPFSNGGAESASYYLSKLAELKLSKKPFQWILSRVRPNGQPLFHSAMMVGLEDYQITDNADKGLDILVNVSLKQYTWYGTKTITIRPAASPTELATATVSPQKEKLQAPRHPAPTRLKRMILCGLLQRSNSEMVPDTTKSIV